MGSYIFLIPAIFACYPLLVLLCWLLIRRGSRQVKRLLFGIAYTVSVVVLAAGMAYVFAEPILSIFSGEGLVGVLALLFLAGLPLSAVACCAFFFLCKMGVHNDWILFAMLIVSCVANGYLIAWLACFLRDRVKAKAR